MPFGVYTGHTITGYSGSVSTLVPDAALAPDAVLPPGGAGVVTQVETRVKTWLHGAEKTFAFPYTVVVQEEAWLLDALGYTAG